MSESNTNAAVRILAHRIAAIDREIQDRLQVIAQHRKPIELAEAVISDGKREWDALAAAIELIEGACVA